MSAYLRSVIARHGIASVIFVIISLWSIYPVLAHPQSQVIGWKGDNILYAYMTGWVAESLAEGQSPFIDPHANYPDRLLLAGNEAPFLSMLIVAPLTWLFGPVFGYNAIIFLSALLSGLFMYLWIYRTTGSRFGGLIAGVIMILTPYRIVRNYGHLNLISTQALPLFFWSLDVLRRTPRPGWRQLGAVGGSVFLVGCMSQYYLVICALTGLAYYLFGVAAQWRADHPRRAAGSHLATYGFIAGGAGDERMIHWAGLTTSALVVVGTWSARREAHLFGYAIQPLRTVLFFGLIAGGGALLLRQWRVRRTWSAGGGALLAAMAVTSTVGAGQGMYAWLAGVAMALWGGAGGLWMVRRLRETQSLRSSLKYLVSAGIGAGLSALPYLSARQNTSYKAYPIADTRWLSASPENFLVPSRLHPLWGEWIDRNIPLANRLDGGWIEHTAYLGVVTIALALVAICWRRTPHRRILGIWAGTIGIAILFAFGTDVHLAGRPISASAPEWLPMYYLSQLPVISLMRVWARFSIVVIVLAAAMAGVGAAHIATRLAAVPRRRVVVMAAIMLCVMLDLAPGRLDHTDLSPRSIDVWLAQQPGQFAAAFLPAGVEPFPALFGRLTHGKDIPAFSHGHHLPAAYNDFERRAETFPDPDSLRQLRELKLQYLLINLNAYDAAQRDRIARALAATPAGRIVTQVDEWMVFEFSPCSPGCS